MRRKTRTKVKKGIKVTAIVVRNNINNNRHIFSDKIK